MYKQVTTYNSSMNWRG